MSCNFGLKSYLRLQIELGLHACSILKSCVWFQTKLHSIQLNLTAIIPLSAATGFFFLVKKLASQITITYQMLYTECKYGGLLGRLPGRVAWKRG